MKSKKSKQGRKRSISMVLTLNELKNLQNATIERCAQFAENYFEMEYEKGYGEMIADAMRLELLKDKP